MEEKQVITNNLKTHIYFSHKACEDFNKIKANSVKAKQWKSDYPSFEFSIDDTLYRAIG